MGGAEFLEKTKPLVNQGVLEVFVDLLGLEPRLTEPKSGVLPLHHRSKAPQK
jgi:hypothetical protein